MQANHNQWFNLQEQSRGVSETQDSLQADYYRGIHFTYSFQKYPQNSNCYSIFIKYSENREGRHVEDEVFSFDVTEYCKDGVIDAKILAKVAKDLVRLVHSATLAFDDLKTAMLEIETIYLSETCIASISKRSGSSLAQEEIDQKLQDIQFQKIAAKDNTRFSVKKGQTQTQTAKDKSSHLVEKMFARFSEDVETGRKTTSKKNRREASLKRSLGGFEPTLSDPSGSESESDSSQGSPSPSPANALRRSGSFFIRESEGSDSESSLNKKLKRRDRKVRRIDPLSDGSSGTDSQVSDTARRSIHHHEFGDREKFRSVLKICKCAYPQANQTLYDTDFTKNAFIKTKQNVDLALQAIKDLERDASIPDSILKYKKRLSRQKQELQRYIDSPDSSSSVGLHGDGGGGDRFNPSGSFRSHLGQGLGQEFSSLSEGEDDDVDPSAMLRWKDKSKSLSRRKKNSQSMFEGDSSSDADPRKTSDSGNLKGSLSLSDSELSTRGTGDHEISDSNTSKGSKIPSRRRRRSSSNSKSSGFKSLHRESSDHDSSGPDGGEKTSSLSMLSHVDTSRKTPLNIAEEILENLDDEGASRSQGDLQKRLSDAIKKTLEPLKGHELDQDPSPLDVQGALFNALNYLKIVDSLNLNRPLIFSKLQETQKQLGVILNRIQNLIDHVRIAEALDEEQPLICLKKSVEEYKKDIDARIQDIVTCQKQLEGAKAVLYKSLNIVYSNDPDPNQTLQKIKGEKEALTEIYSQLKQKLSSEDSYMQDIDPKIKALIEGYDQKKNSLIAMLKSSNVSDLQREIQALKPGETTFFNDLNLFLEKFTKLNPVKQQALKEDFNRLEEQFFTYLEDEIKSHADSPLDKDSLEEFQINLQHFSTAYLALLTQEEKTVQENKVSNLQDQIQGLLDAISEKDNQKDNYPLNWDEDFKGLEGVFSVTFQVSKTLWALPSKDQNQSTLKANLESFEKEMLDETHLKGRYRDPTLAQKKQGKTSGDIKKEIKEIDGQVLDFSEKVKRKNKKYQKIIEIREQALKVYQLFYNKGDTGFRDELTRKIQEMEQTIRSYQDLIRQKRELQGIQQNEAQIKIEAINKFGTCKGCLDLFDAYSKVSFEDVDLKELRQDAYARCFLEKFKELFSKDLEGIQGEMSLYPQKKQAFLMERLATYLLKIEGSIEQLQAFSLTKKMQEEMRKIMGDELSVTFKDAIESINKHDAIKKEFKATSRSELHFSDLDTLFLNNDKFQTAFISLFLDPLCKDPVIATAFLEHQKQRIEARLSELEEEAKKVFKELEPSSPTVVSAFTATKEQEDNRPLNQKLKEKIHELETASDDLNSIDIQACRKAQEYLLLENELKDVQGDLEKKQSTLDEKETEILADPKERSKYYKRIEESTLKDFRMYLVSNGIVRHESILPAAEELLMGALVDTISYSSKLAEKRHYLAKKQDFEEKVGRRDKLQKRCEWLLLSRLGEDTQVSSLLSQGVKDQIIVQMTPALAFCHKEYLEKCTDWDAHPDEQYNQLCAMNYGPLANFSETMSVKKEGGCEILQMGQGEDALVFSHEGNGWFCDLGGERWEFHPKILEDYPDLQIPSFSQKISSQSKGWLALRKPESGEMAILARDDYRQGTLRLYKAVKDSQSGTYLAYRHKRGDLDYTGTCREALLSLMKAQIKSMPHGKTQLSSNATRSLQASYRQLMGAYEDDAGRERAINELKGAVQGFDALLQDGGCLSSSAILENTYIPLYDPKKVKASTLSGIDIASQGIRYRALRKDAKWEEKLKIRRDKKIIQSGDIRYFEEKQYAKRAKTFSDAVGVLHGEQFKRDAEHKYENLDLHKKNRKQEVQEQKSLISGCTIENFEESIKQSALKQLDYHESKQRQKVASLHRQESLALGDLEEILDAIRQETKIDTIDTLISTFAKGEIPNSYANDPEKRQKYVQTIGTYLQINIEADMREATLAEFVSLKGLLGYVSDSISLNAYNKRIEAFTQRLDAIERGVGQLQGMPFDENLRVILNCGYRTRKILRPEQVQELLKVFKTLNALERDELDAPGFKKALNLGTGYGKTFLCMPIADNARQKMNRAGHSRAIVVMSRGDAQADFNAEMTQYFANVGVDFFSVGFADRPATFWENEEAIMQVQNKIQNCIQESDIKPIGCSMEDRVMLSFMLRHHKEKDPAHSITQALEEIETTLNKGFCILDEWDSQIMPFRQETVREITGKINTNLREIGLTQSDFKEKDILQNHNNYVGGLKDHLALSATRGTQEALNMMSGKEKVATDPTRGIGRTLEVLARSQHQKIGDEDNDFQQQMQKNFHKEATRDVIFVDSGSYYKKENTTDEGAAELFFHQRREALKKEIEKGLQEENHLTSYEDIERSPGFESTLPKGLQEKIQAYKSCSLVFYKDHKEDGKTLRRRFIMKADTADRGGTLLLKSEQDQMRRTQGAGVSYFLTKQEEVGIDVPQNFRHKVYATGSASIEHLSQIIGRGRKLDEGQEVCIVVKEKDLALSSSKEIQSNLQASSEDDLKDRYLQKVAELEMTDDRLMQTKATLSGSLAGVCKNGLQTFKDALKKEERGQEASYIFEESFHPSKLDCEVGEDMQGQYRAFIDKVQNKYQCALNTWHGTRDNVLKGQVKALEGQVKALGKDLQLMQKCKLVEMPFERFRNLERFRNHYNQLVRDKTNLEGNKSADISLKNQAIQLALRSVLAAYQSQEFTFAANTASTWFGLSKRAATLEKILGEGAFNSLKRDLFSSTRRTLITEDEINTFIQAVADLKTSGGKKKTIGEISTQSSLLSDGGKIPTLEAFLKSREQLDKALKGALDAGKQSIEDFDQKIQEKEGDIHTFRNNTKKNLEGELLAKEEELKQLTQRKERVEKILQDTYEKQNRVAQRELHSLKEEFEKYQGLAKGLGKEDTSPCTIKAEGIDEDDLFLGSSSLGSKNVPR